MPVCGAPCSIAPGPPVPAASAPPSSAPAARPCSPLHPLRLSPRLQQSPPPPPPPPPPRTRLRSRLGRGRGGRLVISGAGPAGARGRYRGRSSPPPARRGKTHTVSIRVQAPLEEMSRYSGPLQCTSCYSVRPLFRVCSVYVLLQCTPSMSSITVLYYRPLLPPSITVLNSDTAVTALYYGPLFRLRCRHLLFRCRR